MEEIINGGGKNITLTKLHLRVCERQRNEQCHYQGEEEARTRD